MIKNIRYWEAFVDIIIHKEEDNKNAPRHRGSMIAMPRRRTSIPLGEGDEEEKCEILPFEGIRRRSTGEDFLDANASSMGNNIFPISAETSHRLKPIYEHSNSLSVIEKDEDIDSQSLELATRTEENLPAPNL